MDKPNNGQPKYLIGRHIKAFDFVRVIAILMVIFFHYNSASPYMDKYGFIGGREAVTLFFILSGASLINRYYYDFDCKTYFKNRFHSIYPTFWLAYLAVFIVIFVERGFFYEAPAPLPSFIFTVVGIDGLLSFLGMPTFYLIGEWFLGVILIIYVLFPLFRKIFIKYPNATLIVLFVLRFILVFANAKTPLISPTLIGALPDFAIGAWFMLRYKHYRDKKAASDEEFILPGWQLSVISILGIILGLYIGNHFELVRDLGSVIFSYGLFFLLLLIAKSIKAEWFWNVIRWFSVISFDMYLLQHLLINKYMPYIMMNFNRMHYILGFFFILFVITCCGYVLHKAASFLKKAAQK